MAHPLGGPQHRRQPDPQPRNPTTPRDLPRERQAEGIAIAKAKGKYKGRKRVLTAEQVDKARARIEAGEGPSVIARNLGVGRSTLYRALQRVEAGGRGRTSH